MKKFMRALVLCCVLAAALSVTAWAGDIYTAADLANMADKDGIYYLRNDLDLTDYGNWTPINFSGVFDGMGHTIKGIKVSGYKSASGLFSWMGGTVQNLHIDVDITDNGEDDTGGLAGYNDGIVDRVSVSGRIRVTSDNAPDIGGLVGENYGKITNCCSSVSVIFTAGLDYQKSYSSSRANCGGLVGYSWSSDSSIVNSYVTGTTTTHLSNAEQTVEWDGLIGSTGGTILHSYYCHSRNYQQSGGGIYQTEEDMKQQETYVDWDFSTVWAISPSVNDGFPYLREPETVLPDTVSLNREKITLNEGASQMLQATIMPANTTARHLDWYSSDTNIVDLSTVSNSTSGEINARIMVNAKAPGVAVVTAVTTEGRIEAQCVVTVPSGNPEPMPTYRLNGITIQNEDGGPLGTIPAGTFLATVSVTNIATTEHPVIMLGAYTDKGQFAGLFYITLKSPVGGTMEATIPIDNSGGNIAQLKAFAIASFADMTPLSGAVSFPAA